jgi:hypothetical protein
MPDAISYDDATRTLHVGGRQIGQRQEAATARVT